MKIKIYLCAVVGLSISGIAIGAPPSVDEIKKCVADRLEAVRIESERDVSLGISAHCAPGHNELFKGCVGRETKDDRFPLAAKPGWKLVVGSGSVQRTGGDTPSRTGVELAAQDAGSVVGRAWCNGHGCGGEGAVHVDGLVKARERRIMTESDQNEALGYCLDKMLPETKLK
ncbi:MAG: hypothetical protein QM661_13395 [Solimonas sp.]